MSWISVDEKLPELSIDEEYRRISEYILVKDKWGQRYTAYLEQCIDKDDPDDVYPIKWIEFGRDAYKAEFIEFWQLMPE